jgi:hypothetical protein
LTSKEQHDIEGRYLSHVKCLRPPKKLEAAAFKKNPKQIYGRNSKVVHT